MQPVGAREVIEFYNEHLTPTDWPRSIWKDSDVKLANAFIRWCNEHEVSDPKLWIWMRFKFLKKGHPSFASLGSEALLPSYRRLAARKDRTKVVLGRGKGAEVRALIDCSDAHETVRERYKASGKIELCVLQPSLTGGFHPHSDTCVLCERATECAAKLNAKHGFDVVALRLGKLDTLPERIRRAVGG